MTNFIEIENRDFAITKSIHSVKSKSSLKFANKIIYELGTFFIVNEFSELNEKIKTSLKTLTSPIPNKYAPYIKTIVDGFPMENFEIKKVFIKEKNNELWILAKYVNSEISNEFFEKAYDIWENIFIDVDVILIGENECKTASLSDNLELVYNKK